MIVSHDLKHYSILLGTSWRCSVFTTMLDQKPLQSSWKSCSTSTEARAMISIGVITTSVLLRSSTRQWSWTVRLIPSDPTLSFVAALISFSETGGLFRLALRLMQVFSEDKTHGLPSSSSLLSSLTSLRDYIPLVNLLGLYYQIRDDYLNLMSDEYQKNKSFAEGPVPPPFPSFLTLPRPHRGQVLFSNYSRNSPQPR